MAYHKFKLGDLVEQYDEININGEFSDIDDLQGINSNKFFQECKSNKNDIDLYRYQICRKGMFSYNRATSRNGEKISIAYRKGNDCLVSPSYYCFKVKDEDVLCSEYLDIWFKRPIFDRYARFNSWGSATEFFTFDDFCNTEIMLPSIDEQRKIVRDYQVVTNRIELLNRINDNLAKQVDIEFQSLFGKYDVLEKGLILPDGWNVVHAEERYNISIGKTPPREETECFSYNDNDITWVSIADMKKANPYILDSAEKLTSDAVADYNVKVINPNTVLLSFKMTVGRVAISDCEMTTNEAIAHFPCKEDYLFYTYCLLKNYNYAKLGSTSSITTAINSKIIKAMPLLWPDYQSIMRFNKSVAPYFSLMKIYATEVFKLEKLKNTFVSSLSR